MGLKLFISHSTADFKALKLLEFANKLKFSPEINDIMVWERDFSDDIVSFMNEGLELCDVLILICTHNSINSKPVLREWGACLMAGKKIVPIFDEVENIPFILRSIKGIKFEGDLVSCVEELCDLLFSIKNKPEKLKSDGYCIRCRISIPYNKSHPLCYGCYQIWAKYKNPKYIENYCHKCGRHYNATIDYPLCEHCINKEISNKNGKVSV